MRLGSKWIAAPAAGLVLLVGGIGVASAMSDDDRSASVTTTAPTLTEDRAGARGNGADDPAADDRGTRSGQDSANNLTDDRGAQAGQDSARDLAEDPGTQAGQDEAANLTGTAAQRARAAALAAVPGASVREVESRTDAPGDTYHVELVQRDGTRVEVDLNAKFEPVKVERSGHDD